MPYVTWSAEETKLLISVFGEQETQKKLGGLYRNKNVYLDISKKLAEHGYSKTMVQCRTKIKNLKTAYKKAKDNNQRSGRNRATCPFYEDLNIILGDHPTSQPIAVMDSADLVDGSDIDIDGDGDDSLETSTLLDCSHDRSGYILLDFVVQS
ncbi:hypothetical protein ACEWY4_024513 [Coilia grayii]|uniref:Myb/SANT-like DNA-binding domain-containing protein n=1 Tax=Coilia grayii TaxID=363190 RepID=A0ABD1J0J4_9TELE